MLDWHVNGSITMYYCKECGEKLVEVHDIGEGWLFNYCPHYKWEIVSIDCYYEDINGCDVDEIRKLKKEKVLRVFSGSNVYLLLPKSQ